MIKNLKIAAAQINPTVGDLVGNEQKIERIWSAQEGQCDLLVFPEMCLTGYPLEDLVLRPSFVADVARWLTDFAVCHVSMETAVLIGAPWAIEGKVYNAAFLIDRGHITPILKHGLPNYGVFEEVRIFEPGPMPNVTDFRGHKLGVMICWDFWTSEVAAHLKAQGAECLIVPNGSTYENTKHERRLAEGRARTAETGLPLLYVNLVGGQDELVFDGGSFAMSGAGDVILHMKAFEEDVQALSGEVKSPYPQEHKAIYTACVLGLRDYVQKSGFSKVLLGLSGGIDSALTAVMAVDALGAANVTCVMLPSNFTSQESFEDACALAHNLGVGYEEISILPAMTAFDGMLTGLSGLAHENMQARARGVTLMSLSNQFGALLLSTGNKSEIAMGYSTLYGDMCGAFNPLKDVYKTMVFALSRLRNEWVPDLAEDSVVSSPIPVRIITKAPSAELRDGQKDEDSLPPYDVLDQILERMIEGEESQEDIIVAGFESDTVRRVYKALHGAEYKRRQSCPGVNVTTKSFGGRARRYPMVNKY